MFNKKSLFLGMIAVIGSSLLLTGCGKKVNVDVDINDGGNDKPVAVNTDYLNISTTDLSVPVGSTNTFNIALKNAVGRFDITVNNGSIASVSEDKLWIESVDETEDVKTITVTGNTVGTTQVVVTLSDVATYDTETELTGSYTINVTVK